MADHDQTGAYLARSTHDILRTYIGDDGEQIAENLIALSAVMPSVLGDPGQLRPAEKQVSWGITRRDGKFKVIILADGVHDLRVLQEFKDSGILVDPITAQAHLFDPIAVQATPASSSLKARKRNPGASIAHKAGYPGTLGCFVRTTRPGNWIGVISASHVLGRNGISKPGDDIFSPGRPDGPGNARDKIGRLDDFSSLPHFEDPYDNYLCCVDVAVVNVTDYMEDDIPAKTTVWSPDNPDTLMPITKVIGGQDVANRLGERVTKVGRTTGMTHGILDIVGLQRQRIVINKRDYIYTNLLAVKCVDGPFSKAGDSGALVYTHDGCAIGLVVAGTEQYTFVSPLDACLREANVTLLE